MPVDDAPRVYEFAPDVGRWRVALLRLIRSICLGEDQQSAIEREIATVERSAGSTGLSPDAIKYEFVLSLLQDVCRAGGELTLSDSRMFVAWPDWHASDGRELAKVALAQARERRVIVPSQLGRLSRCFLPDAPPEEVLRFLAAATFSLRTADEVHPSGTKYGEVFSAGLELWNMPYRGRTGRTKRFVVTGEIEGNLPVAVGLIELGDDTPYNTERDALLGLRPVDFIAWADADPDRLRLLQARFRSLRRCLLPVEGVSFTAAAARILAAEATLTARATGRSQSDEDFIAKKRIAYALRLAHGELAMGKMLSGEALPPDHRGLREGLRALKDLTVPRVTMEVTVCGSLPPFASALGGKLVVAFLAHPSVLQVTAGSAGSITGEVFRQDALQNYLPDDGLLGLTTKGLYPFHSALYNRAEVPSAPGHRPLRLRKIGETRGATTTLLSPRTSRLAQKVLEEVDLSRQVSMRYGTGGAKRQRRIESAVVSTGLPQTIAHAGIRRPVYGLRLAGNVEDVVWGGAKPEWDVLADVSTERYCAVAADMWRSRWLEVARARLSSASASLEGVLTILAGSGHVPI